MRWGEREIPPKQHRNRDIDDGVTTDAGTES
jgi:hypothetical protein